MNKIKVPNFKFRYICVALIIMICIYAYINFNSVNIAKETSANIVKEKYAVGGEVAGIRLLASGVLVMGVDFVDTHNGSVNTVEGVDLKIGDIILEVNGNKVETNKELIEYTENSKGKEITLKVMRKTNEKYINIKPVKCIADDKYKLGLWVKDSSAGVGTITMYNKANGRFAGLGHGITETKENYILPILTGGLASTSILDVRKGEIGNAGELRGTLTTKIKASIRLNTEYGIYGTMLEDTDYINKEEFELASKNEIKEGKAYIYCCIKDNITEKYDVKINKVIKDSKGNKNMVVEIIDPILLESTGGIVQGMSGSPIIQNNKIVGAITHVFLNEPKKGYAVFIENMVEDLKKIV